MAFPIKDIHLRPRLSLGICNDSVLFLRCACVLRRRWLDVRVVMGNLNYYLVLCRNAPMDYVCVVGGLPIVCFFFFCNNLNSTGRLNKYNT